MKTSQLSHFDGIRIVLGIRKHTECFKEPKNSQTWAIWEK